MRGRDDRRRQAGGIDQVRARLRIRSITAARRRDSRHSRRSPSTACPSAAARRPGRLDEVRAAAAADHAEAVGVVGHQPGVVTRGQRRELMQRREVAVHGEHAVGDDQRALMTPAMLRQQRPDMPDIVVAERQHGGARQPRAGPQAGMRQLVDQDQVAAADQRRHDAGIGEIAGAEHAGGFRALEPREPLLQLGVIAG